MIYRIIYSLVVLTEKLAFFNTVVRAYYILNCVNIRRTSEAANLVFQSLFILNSIKHKFFNVSIVKYV